MPSSTSSFDGLAMREKYGRPLPAHSLRLAAIIALFVALVLLSGWEIYWRTVQGIEPSYRNSEGLWATERRRINNGEGHKTVLIGSSRTLFNIQLDVWEAQAGERPIQLALEGTTPVPVLEGLADDPDFTGTLLIGVAPDLFFSGFAYREKAIARYEEETPSQWIGQRVSMLFEPWLAFYNFDTGLFTVLKRQPWPARADVRTVRDVRKLSNMERDRNTRLWSKVVTDTDFQQEAKEIWAQNFVPIEERDEEFLTKGRENTLQQIERAQAAVHKLRTRGVDVIFVRHISEGHFAIQEPMYFPREQTWDLLLEKSGAPGLHFADHEAMQGYYLPEWSHMTGEEADRYTAALYHLVQETLAEHAGERRTNK